MNEILINKQNMYNEIYTFKINKEDSCFYVACYFKNQYIRGSSKRFICLNDSLNFVKEVMV